VLQDLRRDGRRSGALLSNLFAPPQDRPAPLSRAARRRSKTSASCQIHPHGYEGPPEPLNGHPELCKEHPELRKEGPELR